jgi:hypothetical protein
MDEVLIKDLASLFDILKTPEIKKYLEDSSNVLLLQIKVKEKFDELSLKELQLLHEMSINKSIVIHLASQNCAKMFIVWKSRELDHFMVFKHYDQRFTEQDNKIYEYIADFLTGSLSKGYLGKI